MTVGFILKAGEEYIKQTINKIIHPTRNIPELNK